MEAGMNRRVAGKLAAAALLTPVLRPAWLAAEPTRVRFSFMMWALAKRGTFDQCVEMVAGAGYQGIELVGEFQHWTPEERRRLLKRLGTLGLTIDAMSGVKAGFAVPGETTAFLAQFAEHLRDAKELGCPQVILLSGDRVDGMERAAQMAVATENLKRAAEMAAGAGIEIVIEPLDLLEQPKFLLASVTDGFALAEAVRAPNLKVLYDFFHEQRSFGNLIEKLELNIARVGLVHVADVPGRHEPGTGEVNYRMIYRKLKELKYDRWIAMEYYPTGDVVGSLQRARVEASGELG
jgi:hydroxypyruvate isomerase